MDRYSVILLAEEAENLVPEETISPARFDQEQDNTSSPFSEPSFTAVSHGASLEGDEKSKFLNDETSRTITEVKMAQINATEDLLITKSSLGVYLDSNGGHVDLQQVADDSALLQESLLSRNGNLKLVDTTEQHVLRGTTLLSDYEREGRSPRRGQKNVSESDTATGFEAVLRELGQPGKFFWIQLVIHTIGVFCMSNAALVYIFIGYEPAHTCRQLPNETEFLAQYNISQLSVQYGSCEIVVQRNTSRGLETLDLMGCVAGYDYGGQAHISFVSEWDLVCSNMGLKETVQTVLMVGQTVGALIFTSIADKYGRKPILLACNFLLCVCGLASGFSPNVFVLIGLKFFCGLFQQGFGLVDYTMIMELLTARHRRTVGVLCGLNWTFGVLVFSLVAYLLKDASWRVLQIVTALFACNFLIGPFFMCESPRWLVANRRHPQALAILRSACKTNGKDYDKVKAVFDTHVVAQQYQEKIHAEASGKGERYSLLDIVRHRSLFVSALILWFIWITNATTYYGLLLATQTLAGDRHLNFFLMSLVDLPADLVNFFTFTYFGRKTVIMSWMIVAGLALLTATLLMSLGATHLTGVLAAVSSFVGKFGISASFNGIFMYTPELFPTNVRSAGLGVCSSVSRLGGMIVPYSQVLADVVPWGPGTIFSIMCFLSVAMFLKLPETRGQPMPNTIREMKLRAVRSSKKQEEAL